MCVWICCFNNQSHHRTPSLYDPQARAHAVPVNLWPLHRRAFSPTFQTQCWRFSCSGYKRSKKRKIKISFYLYLRHLFKIIRKWPWHVSNSGPARIFAFQKWCWCCHFVFGLVAPPSAEEFKRRLVVANPVASWRPPLRGRAEGHRASTNVHTHALSPFPLICTIFPKLRGSSGEESYCLSRASPLGVLRSNEALSAHMCTCVRTLMITQIKFPKIEPLL